jgi:tetratricopeptide (TPR) repeat protein
MTTRDPSPDSREIGALVALVNQDRVAEAEAQATALLARYPAAGMLWKILGVARARQGRDPLTALRKTAELLPQDAEAHLNLGLALRDQGALADALAALERARALQPTDTETLLTVAEVLRALGRPAESLVHYERALQRDPQAMAAHNDLGNAYLQLGRHEEALQSYRRALALAPREAQVHLNLGNALRLAGRFEEALASSRRAIELDPQLGLAYDNAGLVLVALGRRAEAIPYFRHALARGPVSVDMLTHLANTLRDTGARVEAASVYQQAIALDPRHVESFCNLGNLLFQLHRIEESAAAYRHALALQPDHVPAHVSLGVVLRQQRQPAEAEASCRTALRLDPDYAEALHVLGELCADRGEFTAAEGLFRRAIALKPDYAAAYNSIAAHRRMTPADGDWLAGAEALLRRSPPLEQEIGLRFALGKYFDDVGRYADAFPQYRQANELTKRYGAVYDPVRLTARIDAIIRHFDAGFVGRAHTGASDSALPVLVVGMPRSGTSLTEQIIASHGEARGAGEVAFWNTAFNRYRDAGTSGADRDALMAGLADQYLTRLAPHADGAPRVVDKMPANFMHLGLIHAVFPRARIIHVRRHPLDTCLSIYFQNFFNMGPHANDLAALAHYYREYLRITDHWRSVLPPGVLLEVPYESLVADQEEWSRRMIGFVGLAWDPRCLEFHRTDRVVLTASKWQVRQKIHSGSTGRWRHYEAYLGPLRSLAD